MTPWLQPDRSSCPKPAHVTEASSAPSPALPGWDLCLLPPDHDPPSTAAQGPFTPLTPWLALLTSQSKGKSRRH